MKERNIIKDNRRAGYFSFLYYLHEEKEFHSDALVALCQYLERMDSVSLEQLKTYVGLNVKFCAIWSIILIQMI